MPDPYGDAMRSMVLLFEVLMGFGAAILLIAFVGCGGSTPISSLPVSTAPIAPAPPTPPAVGAIIPKPSLLVGDDANDPYIFVFPTTASGSPPPTAVISNARNVSTDASGNIYVVSGDGVVQEFLAGQPIGTPVRSIPLPAGTDAVKVVKSVSPTGEIFVADAKGISVFSATANGNDQPARYIVGNSQPNGSAATAITPGYALAVDGADNVYMSNSSATPIVVFGPTDSGTVVPRRALGGAQTMLSGKLFGVYGLAIDGAGNLYVNCYCEGAPAILEFSPTADGNVAPIRVISGALTSIYVGGITVDAAGNIYHSTTTNYVTQSVMKFSPDASGNVAPDSILTVGPWTGYDQSVAIY
jgi:hypothetical protein